MKRQVIFTFDVPDSIPIAILEDIELDMEVQLETLAERGYLVDNITCDATTFKVN